MRRVLMIVASITALAAAGAAKASSYDFSYTAAGGLSGLESGAGEIMISDTEMGGAFQVTDISGEANLFPITGLSSYAAADNEVFPSSGLVDLGGISVATASGTDYNFYSYGGAYYVLSSAADAVGYPQNGSPVTSLTITPVGSASAVPEPATWLLMFAGIGGIGLMLRRAKQISGLQVQGRLHVLTPPQGV